MRFDHLSRLRRYDFLRGVEQVRTTGLGGSPRRLRLYLYLSDRAGGRERVEQTRLGPAGMPQSWLDGLAAADVEVRTRTVNPGLRTRHWPVPGPC